MIIPKPSIIESSTFDLTELNSNSSRGYLKYLLDNFPWIKNIPAGKDSRIKPLNLHSEDVQLFVSSSSYHLIFVLKFNVVNRINEVRVYYAVFHIDNSTSPTVLSAFFFPVSPRNAMLTYRNIPTLLDTLDENLVWLSNFRIDGERKIFIAPNLYLHQVSDVNLQLIGQYFMKMLKTYKID